MPALNAGRRGQRGVVGCALQAVAVIDDAAVDEVDLAVRLLGQMRVVRDGDDRFPVFGREALEDLEGELADPGRLRDVIFQRWLTNKRLYRIS